MAVIMPWENICIDAPTIPSGVSAAMPRRQKPMWLTEE